MEEVLRWDCIGEVVLSIRAALHCEGVVFKGHRALTIQEHCIKGEIPEIPCI